MTVIVSPAGENSVRAEPIMPAYSLPAAIGIAAQRTAVTVDPSIVTDDVGRACVLHILVLARFVAITVVGVRNALWIPHRTGGTPRRLNGSLRAEPIIFGVQYDWFTVALGGRTGDPRLGEQTDDNRAIELVVLETGDESHHGAVFFVVCFGHRDPIERKRPSSRNTADVQRVEGG